ncbi:predicted protein [Nematostella vectensis]|uniref:Solute carrier family 35 member B1 homolog n=1 Tax=Nematostella vectensis TaxID=45351 RepID=A7RI55_NEMVE|nr:predicted protein [Nematostella vectensis]|eukprot:XP_001641157.1 predicted protein [Nematostella vectensis]
MSTKYNTNRGKFLICFLGIFLSYFYYGVIQEKITRTKYGEEKEPFTYALCLVFVQCIVNALFAKLVIKFTYDKKEAKDSTPFLWYGACAATYLGAMLARKSCKPIPVMILGVLFARKRYPLIKYLCVFLIVIGVALFMYKDKPKTSNTEEHSLFGFGEILLIVSLTFDGLTGAVQDRMRAEHHVQSHFMMFNMNLWSIGIMGLTVITTGELFRFAVFCEKFPFVMANVLTFSCASAVGQNFIFMTVANFGPLACSIVTTTRKFFTILGSVLLFGHALSIRQWVGVVCVFVGLGADSILSKSKKK